MERHTDGWMDDWQKVITIAHLEHSSGELKRSTVDFMIELFNSFPASGDWCLLITFANSLDPDQAWQNLGCNLNPNCLTLWWYSWKSWLKKIHRGQKSMPNYPECKELMMLMWYFFLIFFVTEFLYKSMLVGTHLNCLDKSIKNICCWYSFELPGKVKAIQMSTNNICFYKEADKNAWM